MAPGTPHTSTSLWPGQVHAREGRRAHQPPGSPVPDPGVPTASVLAEAVGPVALMFVTYLPSHKRSLGQRLHWTDTGTQGGGSALTCEDRSDKELLST